MAYDPQRLPQLIASLYRVIGDLEAMFPGLPFTPDGQMVSSLGEALVAYHYGITRTPAAEVAHDGSAGTRQIQIKTTQSDTITIGSEPDYLIAIRLSRDGTFEEIFNGPGSAVWKLVSAKKRPKSGEYQVRLSQLRSLMKSAGFTPEQQIARVAPDKPIRRWLV